MSEFKITGPGFYRTIKGHKAEIVGCDSYGHWLGTSALCIGAWLGNGRSTGGTVVDLIAPWTEPKKGTVWVNVYADGYAGGALISRKDADGAASYAADSNPRIACIEVNWTEGEGL